MSEGIHGSLPHLHPSACLGTKCQVPGRGANHRGVICLIHRLHLFIRRPTHGEKSSRESGKCQRSLGGNRDDHMASTLDLLHEFVRSQRLAEPMTSAFLKPMNSPVGLNEKQTRQHMMPLDLLLDTQLHLSPSA